VLSTVASINMCELCVSCMRTLQQCLVYEHPLQSAYALCDARPSVWSMVILFCLCSTNLTCRCAAVHLYLPCSCA
jgi:hypothetical protein